MTVDDSEERKTLLFLRMPWRLRKQLMAKAAYYNQSLDEVIVRLLTEQVEKEQCDGQH